MNVNQALKKLEEKNITTSVQMLRRWIRQGKISATLKNKKEGYVIDEQSLDEFIQVKTVEVHSKEEERQKLGLYYYDLGYKLGYSDGFGAGDKENPEGYAKGLAIGKELIKITMKEREKELISKHLYEQTYKFSYFTLIKDKKIKRSILDFMYFLELKKVTIGVLGSWALIDELNELIDIDELPYPNRQLKTRLKQALLDSLQRRMLES